MRELQLRHRSKLRTAAGCIDRVLDFYRPDVLLLMEGVNDIGSQPTVDGDAGAVQAALTHDVAAARGRGMPGVFLSTLLPVFPENCTPPTSCRAVQVNAAEISIINNVIRSVASQQGVSLVDNCDAFLGDPEYVDTDGLHPLLGNQEIATQFFAAIRSKFETLAPAAQGTRRVSSLDVGTRDCPWDGNTAVVALRPTRQ